MTGRELFGRADACGAVRELLDGSRSAGGRALFVSGDPGIGKSALLAYGQELAVAEGHQVLVTRGFRDEETAPFAALATLLGVVPLDRCGLSTPQLTALLAALAMGDAPAGGVDRLAVGAALLTVLAHLAVERPVLVVVDDLQWVDRPSTDAFRFALRRVERDPVAFLLATRDPRLVGPSDAELHLEGLDDESARQLMAAEGADLDATQVAGLVGRSGGNPLALLDLPRLVDAGRLHELSSAAEPLPIGAVLQDAYGEQIARLPAATRRALVVAALTDGGDVRLLHDALARDGGTMADLGPAEDLRLVSLTGSSVVFRHPLTRSAAVQAAPPSERRSAHRRLADAFADATSADDRSRRAWHLAAAAYGPDERVAALLQQCADSAADRSGYASAAAAYERAAQLTASPRLRCSRSFAAGAAAFNGGQAAHAIELLTAAREDADSDELAVEIEGLLGRVMARTGDPAGAHDRLTAEARRLQDRAPGLAAQLLMHSYAAAVFAGRGREALEAALHGQELARSAGGPYVPLIGSAVAIIRTMLGEGGTSRLLDEALAGFALDASLPDQLLPLIGDIAFGYSILDRFDEAAALHATLLDIATTRAAAGLRVWPVGEQAMVDFRTGRWRQAYAGALEAERLATDAGMDIETANNRQLLATITAARGHADECRRYVELVLDHVRRSGSTVLELLVVIAPGQLELGLGQPTKAIPYLERARDLADQTGFLDLSHFPWAVELVEAYVHCDRDDDARTLAGSMARQAASADRAIVHALAGRAAGLVTADAGVEASFAAALDHHAASAWPFETARTQLCFGQRLRRLRRRGAAREQLRAAWETFSRLGADGWAARAGAELSATGVSTPARARTPADLLTPQELQVALAVSHGASNRGAAEQLFVSIKTVEYHLGHVYRKLGITSRNELPSTLAAAVR